MKDAFRYFDKHTVIAEMIKTKIDASRITGYNRLNYKGRTVIFETFDALRDPVAYFAEAMNTEMEHGRAGQAEGTNVTDDDAFKTAQIAAAHLKGVEAGPLGKKKVFEYFPDYYDWLWWMESLHERALARL